MLVLSRADVEGLLDPRELIDALATAMADLSAGRASMPNRVAAFVPEHEGLLAAMPGYVPALGALTTKLVSPTPSWWSSRGRARSRRCPPAPTT